MTTRLQESIIRLENRWREADRLSRIAKRNKRPENRSLLNGVSIVLQTAHFEASLKEICEAIIEDLNENSSHGSLSIDAKKQYIRSLFGDLDTKLNSKEGEAGISKIIDWVYDSNLKLDKKKFSDTEGNPKPDTIKKLAKQFGVVNLFITMSTTDMEYWLATNESNDFEAELKRIQKYLKRSTKSFPYSILKEEITIESNSAATKESNVSLFSNLNTSLKHRNIVAHSGLMEEEVSDTDVKVATLTFRSITLYFIAIICLKLQSNLIPVGHAADA